MLLMTDDRKQGRKSLDYDGIWTRDGWIERSHSNFLSPELRFFQNTNIHLQGLNPINSKKMDFPKI